MDFTTAMKVLKEQRFDAYEDTFSIESAKSRRTILKYTDGEVFRADEIENDWLLLVPDTDKESKCEKIREMAKSSNWLGESYARIDNMTIEEMFERVSNKIDDDKKYLLLKDFFEKELYKKGK